jgi:hypothetical protein
MKKERGMDNTADQTRKETAAFSWHFDAWTSRMAEFACFDTI